MSAVWPGYLDGNNAPYGCIFGIELPGALTKINRVTVDYADCWVFGVKTGPLPEVWNVTNTVTVVSNAAEMHGGVNGVPCEKNKLRLKVTGLTGMYGGWPCNVCAAIVLTFHES